MPGLLRLFNYTEPAYEGTSTADASGGRGLNRRGGALKRFCTNDFFLFRFDRIAIAGVLAAMQSSAGTAAVLARARRGRRG